MPRILELDVSDLEPCEPLERVLAALEVMEADQALCMIHRRKPLPLLPILEQRGFDYRLEELEEARIHLYIWARGRTDLADFCRRHGHGEETP